MLFTSIKINHLIVIISILSLNLSIAQTKSEIDSLINGIAELEDSKGIITTDQAKKIISFGEKSLPTLAEFFTNSTLTNVKSECQERNLTKGELAIIVADRIKFMPYFQLTKIQNCTFTLCERNPNFIEYYLWAINRNGIEKFQEDYLDWLMWIKLSDKEKRKIERKKKQELKAQQRKIKNIGRLHG